MYNRKVRVAMALDTLASGLQPYVEERLKEIYGDRWQDGARRTLREGRGAAGADSNGSLRWDAAALLTVMWDQWNGVFRNHLSVLERSLVSELRDFRNRWAHQDEFGFEDAYRLLDSAARLLTATGSPQAERLRRERRDLLRDEFSREARVASQKLENRRQLWRDITVYVACCAAIVVTTISGLGRAGWVIAVVAVGLFIYLLYERLTRKRSAFFGAHECATCSKVIYGASCPYCGDRFDEGEAVD